MSNISSAGVCSALQVQPCRHSAQQLSLLGSVCWPGRGGSSSSWICDSSSHGWTLQRRLLSSNSGGISSSSSSSAGADAAGKPSAAAARAAAAAQKLQLPPAVASGMVAAVEAASKGAKATARQVGRLGCSQAAQCTVQQLGCLALPPLLCPPARCRGWCGWCSRRRCRRRLSCRRAACGPPTAQPSQCWQQLPRQQVSSAGT